MYSILIVDDHTIVRKGMIQILETAGEIIHFGEAGNAESALKLVHNRLWDLILLDISLPGNRGTQLMESIRRINPKIPVLILSSFPEEQYAVRFIERGAAGYLNKKSAAHSLCEAVKVTLMGDKYISNNVAALLVDNVSVDQSKAVNPRHKALSKREYFVFEQLALGVPVSDISRQEGISVKTVSTYRKRLLDKMQLSTNADLTLYALEHQLIENRQ